MGEIGSGRPRSAREPTYKRRKGVGTEEKKIGFIIPVS